MKRVFFVEPSGDIAPELELYDVVRWVGNEGQYQLTAYRHLPKQEAETKAHELNVEYNQLSEVL